MIKRSERQFDVELQSMLEQAKVIRPVPQSVRARTLARARESVWVQPALPAEPIPAPRGRRLAFAMAASFVALAVGSAGAVVALRSNPHPPQPPSLVNESPPARHPRAPVPASPPAQEPASEPALASPPTSGAPAARQPRTESRRAAKPAESYAAELRLLHQAQTACAARDFTSALEVLREHRQRFPTGRLAEQREALRVRALSGAGREMEASRAADEFAARFPRSVLAPRLRDITTTRVN